MKKLLTLLVWKAGDVEPTSTSGMFTRPRRLLRARKDLLKGAVEFAVFSGDTCLRAWRVGQAS